MIKFVNVIKSYGDKKILDEVSFEIPTGDFVYLMGPSGSGKTTIFKLLVLIERVSGGEVLVDNYNIMKLNQKQIPLLRQQIGVIFQDFKLIQTKNVFENIALVLEVMGKKGKEIPDIIDHVMNIVNLKDKLKSFPPQLSGGEKQKVVIARALVSDPSILLADEPTGNLDPEATDEVVKILQKINESGTTVIMATHDEGVVNNFPHKLIYLRNGKIKEFKKPDPTYRDEYLRKENFEKSFDFLEKKSEVHKFESEPVKQVSQVSQPNIPSPSEIISKPENSIFSKLKNKFVTTKVEDIPQPQIESVKIVNKVEENTTNENLKDVELIENLELPKDILSALKKRGVKSISELVTMTDVTLSRIVGVINIWKVREALKSATSKKNSST